MVMCPRCGEETIAMIMSRFNTEMICMDCDKRERRHPLYAEAIATEAQAYRSGNRNFAGIGKPDDL